MAEPHDADRVTLDTETSIRHWADRFGVSRDELEEAVEAVGDDSDAVAAYLNIAR